MLKSVPIFVLLCSFSMMNFACSKHESSTSQDKVQNRIGPLAPGKTVESPAATPTEEVASPAQLTEVTPPPVTAGPTTSSCLSTRFWEEAIGAVCHITPATTNYNQKKDQLTMLERFRVKNFYYYVDFKYEPAKKGKKVWGYISELFGDRTFNVALQDKDGHQLISLGKDLANTDVAETRNVTLAFKGKEGEFEMRGNWEPTEGHYEGRDFINPEERHPFKARLGNDAGALWGECEVVKSGDAKACFEKTQDDVENYGKLNVATSRAPKERPKLKFTEVIRNSKKTTKYCWSYPNTEGGICAMGLEDAYGYCASISMRLPTAREIGYLAMQSGAAGVLDPYQYDSASTGYDLLATNDNREPVSVLYYYNMRVGPPDHFYFSHDGYQGVDADKDLEDRSLWTSSVRPSETYNYYLAGSAVGPETEYLYFDLATGEFKGYLGNIDCNNGSKFCDENWKAHRHNVRCVQ